MKRFLATPDVEGYFDFFSNLIVLGIYDSGNVQEIQDAINLNAISIVPTERQREIRALLKHEITHFLDMATTAWGYKYMLRKLQAVKCLKSNDEEGIRTRDVFMLETTEVDIHEALLSTSTVAPAECETLHHALKESEQFGMVLLIYYYHGEKCRHTVPLSMLSLLEANATANEYLSRLADLDTIEDKAIQKIESNLIELSFTRLLNDPDRLEYSVLLHLTRIHLRELSFHDVLVFVSALCRFALDATDLGMAAMANPIEASTLNADLGRAISMELRRASARHLLYFKAVLFIYGWMAEMDEADRHAYLRLLRKDPFEAIEKLWVERFGIDKYALNAERSFVPTEQMEWLRECGVLADARIYEESFLANSSVLNRTPCGLVAFNQLKLLDITLGDDTQISPPNRIDIDAKNYFDENLQLFSDLESAYRKQTPQRFYIGPDAVHINVI